MVAAGGLHIVGTERHESRRIDNQLRGRSGRQGDPGSSRFYLSMEDNLMRIFGDPVRTKRLLQMAGMKEGEVIESGMLTRQIEKAQRKVESHNFDIRKQLLLFDDVANDQRKVVYQQRTEIMGTDDLSDAIRGIREEAVGAHRPVPAEERRPRTGISTVSRDAMPRISTRGWIRGRGCAGSPSSTSRRCAARHRRRRRGVRRQGARVGAPVMRHVEKDVMLRMLDQHWRDHLGAMDYLRQGIHLRGYAQKDYRFEYKREAFELFAAMLDRVKFETVTMLATLEVRTQEEIDREEEERRAAPRCARCRRSTPRRARCRRSVRGGRSSAGRRRGAAAGAAGARAQAPPQPPAAAAARARRAQGRAQRAVSVRLGQEVQALPRRARER